jgi:hypothetical protein
VRRDAGWNKTTRTPTQYGSPSRRRAAHGRARGIRVLPDPEQRESLRHPVQGAVARRPFHLWTRRQGSQCGCFSVFGGRSQASALLNGE